jgi:predicted small integral membrane protein
MILRIAKIATAASIAAFLTLVTFGNLTDYDTNFAFVQHVLAMDTIFATSTITTVPSPTRYCTTSPMG